MDKTSIKVLKYLKKQSDPVSKGSIVEKFGKNAGKSLDYLKANGFIREGRRFVSVSFDDNTGRAIHNYGPNEMFEIDSAGLDFLQHKPGNDFDHWLNRLSIILSILGGALLSKPLWAAIEWIMNWFAKYL